MHKAFAMSMQTPIGEISLMSLLCDPDYEENKPDTNMHTEEVRESKSRDVVEVERINPVNVKVVVEPETKKTTANASCQTHVN